MPSYRVVETYLFDTCTLKCGYCWLAENGNVLDASQLAPFRDTHHIDRITNFFNRRTNETEKWHLQLTGGEPLLMPNFHRFCENLFNKGNRISLYTALMVDENHPAFRLLANHRAPDFDYLMCSLHPEAQLEEEKYWHKIRLLKDAGHNVIVRFVGHPKRLAHLDRLSLKCKELDVCFYPTTLFSNNYPQAYTKEERSQLAQHFSSLSQVIQLAGGIDTKNSACHAGSRIIAVHLGTGDITPCISVKKPLLGNLYEDRLKLVERPIACPEAGIACICDVHFQQDIVIGAEDLEYFNKIRLNYVEPLTADQARLVTERQLTFNTSAEKGFGDVKDDQTLIYSKEFVKSRLLRNKLLTSISSVPSADPSGAKASAPAAFLKKVATVFEKRRKINSAPA